MSEEPGALSARSSCSKDPPPTSLAPPTLHSEPKHPHLSLCKAVCELGLTGLGAGTVFVPLVYRRMGLCLGFAMTIVLALVASSSQFFLASAACWSRQKGLPEEQASDYFDMLTFICGQRPAIFGRIVALLFQLAATAISLQFLACFLAGLGQTLCGNLQLLEAVRKTITSRKLCGTLTAVLVVIPVSLALREPAKHYGRATALATSLCAFYCVFFLLYELWRTDAATLSRHYAQYGVPTTVSRDMLDASSQLVYLFMNHLNVARIASRLKDPTRARRMALVAIPALGTVALYTAVGSAGVLLYGASIQGDVLYAPPLPALALWILRPIYALTRIMTATITVGAARTNLCRLADLGRTVARTGKHVRIRHVLHTVSVVGVAVLYVVVCGCYMRHLMEAAGAVLVVVLVCFLPSMAYQRADGWELEKSGGGSAGMRLVLLNNVVFGSSILAFGLPSIVYSACQVKCA